VILDCTPAKEDSDARVNFIHTHIPSAKYLDMANLRNKSSKYQVAIAVFAERVK